MRGKGTRDFGLLRLNGITPAYAGKRLLEALEKIRNQDHPRVCGEKSLGLSLAFQVLGSPPRMRGKVTGRLFNFIPFGITPAYAGKSCLRLFCGHVEQDHPRVCGEK